VLGVDPFFAPSCPSWTVREFPRLRSPDERLNGKRHHTDLKRTNGRRCSASRSPWRS